MLTVNITFREAEYISSQRIWCFLKKKNRIRKRFF